MQDTPYFELEYPFIWGNDVAGTIVQLGSEVTQFKVGQRVIGCVQPKSRFLKKGIFCSGFEKNTDPME